MTDSPPSNHPSHEDERTDVSFLSRWSRRKRGLDVEDAHPATATPEDAPLATSDPAPAEEIPLPDIDSLDEHSDYRGFLSRKVSPELRRQALRKLFRSPSFNVCDGLDVYAEDYTKFQPLGEVVTHEMRRALDRALAREQQQEATAETPAPSTTPDHPAAIDDTPMADASPDDAAPDDGDATTDTTPTDPSSPQLPS